MMTFSRIVLVAVLMSVGIVPAAASDPTGVWVNENGDTKVRLSRCGGGLCGSVAWLREPNDTSGRPKTDKRNPDVAKRDRRMIGVPVLLGMKPEGEGRWSGRIYNADDGKTYSSRVMLAGANSLKVQGCVLGGLFCKSMTWTRTN
jgi:uncharacterized protein (DUF2147 family)